VIDLRKYVAFDEDDAQHLLAVRDALAPEFPRIAQDFYDKIREHKEAHDVFTGEDQIARLQRSLQQWLHRLLGGTYDAAYYAQTAHVGQVHVRVGLPQRYMFSAMALIRLDLVRLIEARANPSEVSATKAALNKAIDIELAIMLEAYRDAFVARLERKQAIEKDELTQSLAQTEHRYAAAMELTRELVIGVDAAGVIRLFNAGAEAVSGFGREEVIGQPLATTLLAEESRAGFEALVRDAPTTSRRLDAFVTTRAGKLRDVRFEIARMGDEIFVIGHDNTEEKLLAERSRQTEKLAAIGTLAAGLAHEIRNPLNGAQLHVAYLERTLKRASANADTLEAVNVVGDEIKRLAVLVTEFLDFARPKPLAKKATSLNALAERVARLLEDDAKAAHVEIACDLPSKELIASVDASKIEQVLLNLARNAIEALAPMNGGHLTVRMRRQPNHAVVEIEDDGPGLPSEDAPIFDAFYSTKPQGTGLGLAITHRIVTDHGGSIEVESGSGRTIFRVSLLLDGDPE
jgi:PAS domain S-box-containing protein